MVFKRLISLFIFFLLIGCSTPSIEHQKSNKDHNEAQDRMFKREAVELVKVIDGDTIEISYNNTNEKVRLLLIDTPETAHPRLGEQPYGQEAKTFTKKLIENSKLIEVELDIGPKRDKYSRMLAYVYVDGKMLQEELLKNGLARVAYIYPPNTRYVDQFREIQEISRKNELGIWEIENYSTDKGFNPDVVEKETFSNDGLSAPKIGCEIKGNINSKGDKIYHTEESPWYQQTKPEYWFCSEEEARSAGFRPVKYK